MRNPNKKLNEVIRKKKNNNNKVHKVMAEFKAGTLKDKQGNIVTSRKQAIAIAMSESGQSWKKRKG
jgi:hypothetical protein